MVDRTRPSGLVALDISECKTDDEARSKIDSYWAPPKIDFSRRRKPKRPVTPPSESPAEESDTPRSPPEPSVSPGSPDSLPRNGFVPKTPPTQFPPSQVLLSRKPSRGGMGNLVDLMKGLFSQSDHELQPSSTKQAELEALRIQEEVEKVMKAMEQARIDRATRRLKRRAPLKLLVEPLDSKWDVRVNETFRAPRDKTITTSLEGTELRHKDFMTLLGQCAWLNDEIINTYIEWVVVAANEAASIEAKAWGEKSNPVPKFIAHNSFFYTNLTKKGPASTDRLMKRKKAEGNKLLEVDTVFVPICQGSHWTIGVVRPFAKTIEYFDSMGGSPTEFVQQMRGWLKHQLKGAYKDDEWTVPRTGCAEQTNGYDCGVFVCTNAFCVASGIDTACYEQQDMTLQRKRIAAVLINRGFTKDFQWGQDGLLPAAEYANWGPDGYKGEVNRMLSQFGGLSNIAEHFCGIHDFISKNGWGMDQAVC